MNRFKSCAMFLFLCCFVVAGFQVASFTDAHGAATITGSTSMTVVYVREWRSGKAAAGSIANYPITQGLYDYHVHVPGQSWKLSPYPFAFPNFPNGSSGGAIWNVYDEGGATGNRSFIAWAWDGIGPTTEAKHEGTGGRTSDNWIGLMISTWCNPTNPSACNGKERSNLIFSHQY